MNKQFWKAAGIRAVKTVCQTIVAMIPTAAMIQQVDWVTVAGTATLAGLCSVLTSVYTGLPEVSEVEDA